MKKGPEYSNDREFTVILEDLRNQFRVFGEKLGTIDLRLTRVEEDLTIVKTDVSVIKLAFSPLITQVRNHENRVILLEKR